MTDDLQLIFRYWFVRLDSRPYFSWVPFKVHPFHCMTHWFATYGRLHDSGYFLCSNKKGTAIFFFHSFGIFRALKILLTYLMCPPKELTLLG